MKNNALAMHCESSRTHGSPRYPARAPSYRLSRHACRDIRHTHDNQAQAKFTAQSQKIRIARRNAGRSKQPSPVYPMPMPSDASGFDTPDSARTPPPQHLSEPTGSAAWSSPHPRQEQRVETRSTGCGDGGGVGWRERRGLCRASSRRIAAIDRQFGAGDEFGFVGDEVDDAPGDVVDVAHVAEGVQFADLFAGGVEVGGAAGAEVVFDHRGPDVAGVHGVHADAVGGEEQRGHPQIRISRHRTEAFPDSVCPRDSPIMAT